MNKEFENIKKRKRVNKVDEQQLKDGEGFQDYVKLCYSRYNINIEFYKTDAYQREFGEGPSGYEMKLDRRCTGYDNTGATNQLSIEYKKYIRNSSDYFNWMPSGFHNHAKLPYYVQGNPDNFWTFKVSVLDELLKLKKNDNDFYFDRKLYEPKSQWKNLKPIVPINQITLSPLYSFLLKLNDCDKYADNKFININDKMVMIENKDVLYNLEKLKEDVANSRKIFDQSIKELFS